jgi:hypothetical protein
MLVRDDLLQAQDAIERLQAQIRNGPLRRTRGQITDRLMSLLPATLRHELALSLPL